MFLRPCADPVAWTDGKGHPPCVELRGSCAGCCLHLTAALVLPSSVDTGTEPHGRTPPGPGWTPALLGLLWSGRTARDTHPVWSYGGAAPGVAFTWLLRWCCPPAWTPALSSCTLVADLVAQISGKGYPPWGAAPGAAFTWPLSWPCPPAWTPAPLPGGEKFPHRGGPRSFALASQTFSPWGEGPQGNPSACGRAAPPRSRAQSRPHIRPAAPEISPRFLHFLGLCCSHARAALCARDFNSAHRIADPPGRYKGFPSVSLSPALKLYLLTSKK